MKKRASSASSNFLSNMDSILTFSNKSAQKVLITYDKLLVFRVKLESACQHKHEH